MLLVLPLHIGRVARVAARQQVEALTDLVDRCLDRLADPASAAGSDLELRASARRVDMAYQALVATVGRCGRRCSAAGAARVAGFMATAVAARHYARNLLLDASTRYADLDAAGHRRPRRRPSPARRLRGRRHRGARPAAADGGQAAGQPALRAFGVAVRARRGRAARSRPAQPAVRSWRCATLQLLDGALAEAARWAGVPVSDLDTVPR